MVDPLWPNTRYVVAGKPPIADDAEADRQARELSRAGAEVSVEVFDAGEPIGGARYLNGSMVVSINDPRGLLRHRR